jgi:uncharacterized glyoxalase superfamily protein PhnB
MAPPPRPAGWPAVIPRIVTPDVAGLVGFVRTVFGATGETRVGMPTELRIADAIVMISDGGGVVEPRAAFLYVYVDDAEATYRRALAGGAQSVEPPTDQPWGDRRATVRDRWGNLWQIAAHGAAAPR